MKVLFLLEGTTVPASRFRVLQLLPAFEAIGVRPTVRYAYGDAYNRLLTTPWARPYQLATRLRRAAAGFDAARFDVVFLQRPALPFSAAPEQVLARLNPRTIFDVDDSIWVEASGAISPWRQRTFHDEVAAAAEVITGNGWLADQAAAPGKTTILPTVVDTDIYRPAPRKAGDGLVIGWMGTMGNFPFVRTMLDDLRAVLDRHPGVRVQLVSNASLPDVEGDARFEQIRWTRETEVPLLQQFDIGLMPLPDTLATRGKCAFKMIQYMAVGRPVIASSVGANVEVFENTEAGALVAPGASWQPALERLIADAQFRQQAGERGRARIESAYSVKAVMPRYQEILERVAALGR
jgi:glycosyltransferase involved in cell wall biosynthesis